MRSFVTILFAVASVATAQQHQQLDPAYLRQYYSQIAQQAGAQGSHNVARAATPIYEQQDQPQYVQQQSSPLKNYPRPAQQQQQQAYVPEQQARQYQPQQQQVQYQPQQQQARPQAKKPQLTQQQEEESQEDYEPSPSYQFGFDVKDDEFTNYQNRKESREGNVIKGSYSVVDSDGFIRTVTYTADPKEGFKAEVVREPTDIVIKFPKPTEKPETFRQAAPAKQFQQPQYQAQPSQQQYRPQQQQQQARPEYAQYQQ